MTEYTPEQKHECDVYLFELGLIDIDQIAGDTAAGQILVTPDSFSIDSGNQFIDTSIISILAVLVIAYVGLHILQKAIDIKKAWKES